MSVLGGLFGGMRARRVRKAGMGKTHRKSIAGRNARARRRSLPKRTTWRWF